ncbi:hypothetical protein [Salinimonas iocasae]|uniref:DUF3592 domain-containing protein n=1 Tax=Salinimonas iocasae TaxID=2572577 RepID=A0A5B7Y9Q2_9ALTE|nr:hypothetical protein [Salinimonas iocasae]QCZ92188.1 hypothetical protein FBQ74_01275 [Salinimonas iocasae]
MKFKDLSQNSKASLAFTGMMIFVLLILKPAPSFDDLTELSGKLEWFESIGKHRDTLRFKLKEHKEKFVYHSVAGSIGSVTDALNKENATLKIAFDPNDSDSAIWEFEDFHPVYQVISDNHLIKSYRSTVSKYKSNSELGIWLLIGGLLASCLFIVMDWSIAKDAN